MNKHELDQIEQEQASVGNTPRRNVRVDDNTWERYLTACVTHGTNASKAMRLFMRAVIEAEPAALAVLQLDNREGATDE